MKALVMQMSWWYTMMYCGAEAIQDIMHLTSSHRQPDSGSRVNMYVTGDASVQNTKRS